MRQSLYRLVVCCLTVLLAVALSACQPGSPEEIVLATRAQYTVSLESFTVQEEEPPVIETVEEGAAVASEAVAEAAMAATEAAEGDEAVAAEEAGEGEGEADEVIESGPRTANVILHLLVRFNGDQALPGVTVEVTQADPFDAEKATSLQWIETADMNKSDVKQYDLTIEVENFEDGDAFAVTLNQSVPPEDRGNYREFAEAAP